jgi:dihydropteroate synthase
MKLACRNKTLDLSVPAVMGILNVTPDSFADGGRHYLHDAAVAAGLRMVAEGARIVDVGGESTRPGATAVSAADELERVIPVVAALVERTDAVISVDTSKPEVIAAAVGAGAHLVNDVRALREPGALRAVAAAGLAVCVMHMQGTPADMQVAPRYADVVAEVRNFLLERVAACRAAGIAEESICVDPGIGFGKNLEHNLALLRNLRAFTTLGGPLLVGVSRKGVVGAITGRSIAERLAGSLALAALCAERGASIVRVHDVAATVDAINVAHAIGALREQDTEQ